MSQKDILHRLLRVVPKLSEITGHASRESEVKDLLPGSRLREKKCRLIKVHTLNLHGKGIVILPNGTGGEHIFSGAQIGVLTQYELDTVITPLGIHIGVECLVVGGIGLYKITVVIDHKYKISRTRKHREMIEHIRKTVRPLHAQDIF